MLTTRSATSAWAGEWVTMTMVVPLGVEAPQDVHHLLAVLGVEVAGGFVGEDQGGLAHDGAGDGGALLLSAGQLVRVVAGRWAMPTRSMAASTRALRWRPAQRR